MVDSAATDRDNMFHKSALYRGLLAERAEILRHKWIESEKVGHDIGFEKALLDWIVKHRACWLALRQQRPGAAAESQKNLQAA